MPRGQYPARFEDARGAEDTVIHNDGRELRMALRGVSFAGRDFDGFSPDASELARASALFSLHRGDLCSYRLVWTMPVTVALRGEATEAPLTATLVLGAPLPNDALDRETLQLELALPTGTLRSSGASAWFEDELLDLNRQLADGSALRSCITCARSDYSPYGHGIFGYLACFRDAKEEYAAVDGKAALFKVWDRMTEYVQETYLCEDYSPRAPGTGYRG